ncbi:hypothetical protein HDU76_007791, partial [Blyttiomyces sp. JEL0837]
MSPYSPPPPAALSSPNLIKQESSNAFSLSAPVMLNNLATPQQILEQAAAAAAQAAKSMNQSDSLMHHNHHMSGSVSPSLNASNVNSNNNNNNTSNNRPPPALDIHQMLAAAKAAAVVAENMQEMVRWQMSQMQQQQQQEFSKQQHQQQQQQQQHNYHQMERQISPTPSSGSHHGVASSNGIARSEPDWDLLNSNAVGAGSSGGMHSSDLLSPPGTLSDLRSSVPLPSPSLTISHPVTPMSGITTPMSTSSSTSNNNNSNNNAAGGINDYLLSSFPSLDDSVGSYFTHAGMGLDTAGVGLFHHHALGVTSAAGTTASLTSSVAANTGSNMNSFNVNGLGNHSVMTSSAIGGDQQNQHNQHNHQHSIPSPLDTFLQSFGSDDELSLLSDHILDTSLYTGVGMDMGNLSALDHHHHHGNNNQFGNVVGVVNPGDVSPSPNSANVNGNGVAGIDAFLGVGGGDHAGSSKRRGSLSSGSSNNVGIVAAKKGVAAVALAAAAEAEAILARRRQAEATSSTSSSSLYARAAEPESLMKDAEMMNVDNSATTPTVDECGNSTAVVGGAMDINGDATAANIAGGAPIVVKRKRGRPAGKRDASKDKRALVAATNAVSAAAAARKAAAAAVAAAAAAGKERGQDDAAMLSPPFMETAKVPIVRLVKPTPPSTPGPVQPNGSASVPTTVSSSSAAQSISMATSTTTSAKPTTAASVAAKADQQQSGIAATTTTTTSTANGSNFTAPAPSAAPPAVKQQRKVAHNAIERRYRNNINERITELRRVVPALNSARLKDGAANPRKKGSGANNSSNNNGDNDDENDSEPDDQDDIIDGIPAATKLNKATILRKATEYIIYLKAEAVKAREEANEYKKLLESLPGGAEALRDRVVGMVVGSGRAVAVPGGNAALPKSLKEAKALANGNANGQQQQQPPQSPPQDQVAQAQAHAQMMQLQMQMQMQQMLQQQQKLAGAGGNAGNLGMGHPIRSMMGMMGMGMLGGVNMNMLSSGVVKATVSPPPSSPEESSGVSSNGAGSPAPSSGFDVDMGEVADTANGV